MAWGFGWGEVGVVGLGCLASSDVWRLYQMFFEMSALCSMMHTNGEKHTDQGHEYYEERSRERVLHHSDKKAEKTGAKLVTNEELNSKSI